MSRNKICLCGLLACAALAFTSAGCRKRGEHTVHQHRIDGSKRVILVRARSLRRCGWSLRSGTVRAADNLVTFGACCNATPCSDSAWRPRRAKWSVLASM